MENPEIKVDDRAEIPIQDLDLVDTRVAARILSMSHTSLVMMRQEKRGPKYYRLGGKTIRYALSDLNDFATPVYPDAARSQG